MNKWEDFFLCLFLGWIGAHKFYEKKYGMGILYLFTFGLFGIGWLIDTIVILIQNISKPVNISEKQNVEKPLEENQKEREKTRIELININESLIKKYSKANKIILYCNLVPYKNNTCIKVYNEDGEPIGDIKEENINEYINKNSEIFYITKSLNDDTGLFNFVITNKI